MLACDGTKIGLGLSNSFVTPIKKSESNETLPTIMRRYDRSFTENTIDEANGKDCAFFKCCRQHLKYLADLVLGRITNAQQLDDQLCSQRTIQLMSVLPHGALPLF